MIDAVEESFLSIGGFWEALSRIGLVESLSSPSDLDIFKIYGVTSPKFETRLNEGPTS